MNSCTHRDPRPIGLPVAGFAQERPRGVDCVSRMTLTGEAGNEDADDLVADELVDDRVLVDQEPRRRVIETVHEPAEVGRAHLPGKTGRTTNVGEQHADVDLRPAVVRLERAEAEPAVVRVLLPGLPVDETHEAPADPVVRRRAELAARRRRNVPEQAAHPLEPGVAALEHGAPVDAYLGGSRLL